MIRLYCTKLDAIGEADYAAEYDRLDARLRLRVDGMRRTADCRRTLAGRILLRRALTSLYGSTEYTVTYGENGKPLLPFCHFNIAHAGEMAVCAVSDRPVGADVSRLRTFMARQRYPLFTPRETAFVNRCPARAGRRFHALWTRKEAFVKLQGGKLADAAVCDTLTPKEVCFHTRQREGYIITVCAFGTEAASFVKITAGHLKNSEKTV